LDVLITGGDGFIGRRLAGRLRDDPHFGSAVRRITLVGLEFEGQASHREDQHITGSITNHEILDAALAQPPDLVFHLAAVTSAAAEKNFATGLQVNVGGTIGLFERLRQQPRAPIVVFPSTIVVFGPPYPPVVDDETWPVPVMSYGAQKLMCEVLLADYTRRGLLHGRSLRLAPIVARPPMRTGAASAFSSALIRELASGRSYVCPVSPDARHWLMSLPCCVDNLLLAARLPAEAFGPRCVVTLPVVYATTREIVDAIARQFGHDTRSLVSYEPDPALDANFGSFPPLSSPRATAAGFRDDGDVDRLVRNAMI
jgi:nucleoside-diphosphate-sugar epimerase